MFNVKCKDIKQSSSMRLAQSNGSARGPQDIDDGLQNSGTRNTAYRDLGLVASEATDLGSIR
jgi:hypothetical protein